MPITFIVAALGVDQRAATRGREWSWSVSVNAVRKRPVLFVAGLGKSPFGELAVREFHRFESVEFYLAYPHGMD